MANLMKRLQHRQEKEKAEAYGREILLSKWREVCRDLDIGLIYILHFKFRWGKDRIKSFYRQWLWVSQQMLEQWQVDGDNTHYWVMEHRLKEDGIDYKDFDEIQAEFEDEFEVNKE